MNQLEIAVAPKVNVNYFGLSLNLTTLGTMTQQSITNSIDRLKLQ